MVPASIGNALTLGYKQQEISRTQLRTFETQLDQAQAQLPRSQDISDLQSRLEAIPGVRLKPSRDLSLEQAQREVATALQNVVPSHLMDRGLHDFAGLKATGVPDEDGDKAFDDEPLPTAPSLPEKQVISLVQEEIGRAHV